MDSANFENMSVGETKLYECHLKKRLLKKTSSMLTLRRPSLEDEGLEIKFSEDCDIVGLKTDPASRRRKFSSSLGDLVDHVYDDSGFNSSDEDRDNNAADSCFQPISKTSEAVSEDRTLVKVPATVADSMVSCDSKTDSTNALIPIDNVNPEVDLTASSSQLALSLSDFDQTANLPARYRRRRRVADSNNNETVYSWHSYLKPSPFMLNDCFQDKGLLYLLACIVYTLFLFFLLGCFGIFMDLIKSALTKDDVAEIRARFSNTRIKRPHLMSG